MAIRISLLLVAFFLFDVIPVRAADPVIGTWKLNLRKSSYNPGPAPMSQLRSYDADTNGVNATVVTVDPSGKTNTAKFQAHYDGKEYPITGASTTNADELVYRKVDDYIAEVVLKHGDRVVANSVRTVSPDGKTLTITYKGTDDRGVQVDNISVYDREK